MAVAKRALRVSQESSNVDGREIAFFGVLCVKRWLHKDARAAASDQYQGERQHRAKLGPLRRDSPKSERRDGAGGGAWRSESPPDTKFARRSPPTLWHLDGRPHHSGQRTSSGPRHPGPIWRFQVVKPSSNVGSVRVVVDEC